MTHSDTAIDVMETNAYRLYDPPPPSSPATKRKRSSVGSVSPARPRKTLHISIKERISESNDMNENCLPSKAASNHCKASATLNAARQALVNKFEVMPSIERHAPEHDCSIRASEPEGFQPALICVLGAPAAGKGSLCKRLARHFGWYHLSVGDYLRKISNAKALADAEPSLDIVAHNFAEEIQDFVEAGELVPAPIMNILLEEQIEKAAKQMYRCVIVDGFPRRLDQVTEFEEFDNQRYMFSLALWFDCPKDIASQRYVTRRLPGRLSDNDELFDKRFQQYEEDNPAILDYFRDAGILLRVDTSGSSAECYGRVIDALIADGTLSELLTMSSSATLVDRRDSVLPHGPGNQGGKAKSPAQDLDRQATPEGDDSEVADKTPGPLLEMSSCVTVVERHDSLLQESAGNQGGEVKSPVLNSDWGASPARDDSDIAAALIRLASR